MRDLEKQVVINTKTIKDLRENLDDHTTDTTNKFDELKKYIDEIDQGVVKNDNGLGVRLVIAEQEIEKLKNRPIGEPGEAIDYSRLVSLEDYHDLVNRVTGTEKRNLE